MPGNYLLKNIKYQKKNLRSVLYDEKEGLTKDSETFPIEAMVAEDRILFLEGKKTIFGKWETPGPCSICSEIHVDLRSQNQKEYRWIGFTGKWCSPELIGNMELGFITI